MSLGNFWKRNLGFFRLGIITNLEYRVNFITDVILQPIFAALIEVTVWLSVFSNSGVTTIAGFGKAYYISYVLWGAFIARITSNWMYEFKMMEDIESGAVNSFLVRPISFFEYYLYQFMGYKICTTAISLVVPLGVCLWFRFPFDPWRLPLVLLLTTYYLIFVHLVSFCLASMAFHFNKVYSFTVAKNLAFWLLSGELFPLDILPKFWKEVLLTLPFSNAVYIPVAFLTGRAGPLLLVRGFATITLGILVFGLLARWIWTSALKSYSGTGA